MTWKLLYAFQKQCNSIKKIYICVLYIIYQLYVGIYIIVYSQIYIRFNQAATDQMTCKLLYAFQEQLNLVALYIYIFVQCLFANVY